MRMPFTRRRQNSGIYGGFGSRAADKAWQPSVTTNETPQERVPKRFRRLRLRRGDRKSRLRREDGGVPGSVLLLAVLFGTLVVAMLVAIAAGAFG